MKFFIAILASFCLVFPLWAAPIEKRSFEYESGDEEQTMMAEDVIPDDMLKHRKVCIHKAELGEQLALKKLHGLPLKEVLNGIKRSHVQSTSGGDSTPWYLVVEMQRLARDAYRVNYESRDDIDRFVLEQYRTCLNYGW